MSKIMKFSVFFIIITLLVITNGAPHDKFSKTDQNTDHNKGLSDKVSQKRIYEDHSDESSEEHPFDYNELFDFDEDHDNYDDSSKESTNSSSEPSKENLNQNSNEKFNLNGTKGQGVDSNHVDTNAERSSTSIDNLVPDKDTKGNMEAPIIEKTTQNPHQEQITKDIFSILDKTTPRQSENKDQNSLINSRIEGQQSLLRKRRHAHGHGFSYGYVVHHYAHPHYHVHRPLVLVPVRTYCYYPFTQSPHAPHPHNPHPYTPHPYTPHPPTHHGNSGGDNHGQDYDDLTEKYPENNEVTSIKTDESDVIPLATTQGPTTFKPTENNLPNFLEGDDNTEYPEEDFKGTEQPSQATDVPETTDNIFIKVFGIE